MPDFSKMISDAFSDFILSKLDSMMSSWLGVGVVALAFGLIVYPMARRLWKVSRWAFAGVALLIVAAMILRPHPVYNGNNLSSWKPSSSSQDDPKTTRPGMCGRCKTIFVYPYVPAGEREYTLDMPGHQVKCWACGHKTWDSDAYYNAYKESDEYKSFLKGRHPSASTGRSGSYESAKSDPNAH